MPLRHETQNATKRIKTNVFGQVRAALFAKAARHPAVGRNVIANVGLAVERHIFRLERGRSDKRGTWITKAYSQREF